MVWKMDQERDTCLMQVFLPVGVDLFSPTALQEDLASESISSFLKREERWDCLLASRSTDTDARQ